MLNRRTLRIKIMQSLFAYEQCKEADYQLAIAHIDQFFQPDLNSMKVQDKDLLKDQRQVALKLFLKKFAGEEIAEHPDPRISQSIEEALAGYAKQTKRDFDYFRKNILKEVEDIQVYYLSVLSLVLALAELIIADKKQPGRHMKSNPVLLALQENTELKKQTLRSAAGWDNRMDLVRDWYRDFVRPDKTLKAYLELDAPDEEAHRSILKHLLRKVILGNTPINAHFEEMDLRWAEDHEIVRSMADKTLKSYETDQKEITIQKLTVEWEDDKAFIDKLYLVAGKLEQPLLDLIAANTKNWEVDRLPLTDRIILHLAIAELVSFPNIPVKVTINEYIELAKQYSTPKSRQFINGILDVMAKELVETGKIKKSGRGLLDNK